MPWRVGRLLLVLSLSSGIAHSQDGRLRGEDRSWLGCWSVEVRESLPGLGRELLLRLDSLPTYRSTPMAFYGFGLSGFGSGRDSTWLTWSAPSADSLTIATIGLGGYLWRFQRTGAGVVGLTFETYDVVPAETSLGPAAARRQACP
jgi:hypothetical protein